MTDLGSFLLGNMNLNGSLSLKNVLFILNSYLTVFILVVFTVSLYHIVSTFALQVVNYCVVLSIGQLCVVSSCKNMYDLAY